MTGAHLAYIRSSRGWTLREMAEAIGDVTHSTIGRWENEPDTVLPSWVEDRLFRRMPITLPLEDLHVLLDTAREQKVRPEELIGQILRAHAQERMAKQSSAENVTPLPELHGDTARVAEDPPSLD